MVLPNEAKTSFASFTSGIKDQDEKAEKPGLRATAHWMLLGLGCTWFLGDSTNLETAWWIDSQPQGDRLGSYIAFCGTVAPASAVLALAIRAVAPGAFSKGVVPAMILLSLISGYLLASNLWTATSWVIYISVFLNQSVGMLMPFGVVPWVITQGYTPALISSLYFGGSIGSLSASVLSMIQSPGDAQRFSPSIFFLIITTPIFLSIYAYVRIVKERIGAVQEPETTDAAPRNCWSRTFSNFRRWWAPTLILALASSVMALGSWTILRSALPFAATHTVPGHSTCAPHCDDFCGGFLSESTCAGQDACQWSTAKASCQEDRGGNYVQWSVSLSQWAFAAGTATTLVLPSMRIYVVPVVWLVPFLLICAMAADDHGTFEFSGAGELLVAAQLLVRFCQGYFEVMTWRYIVWKVGPDAEAATLFCGFVMQAVNTSLGGVVSALVASSGLFSD